MVIDSFGLNDQRCSDEVNIRGVLSSEISCHLAPLGMIVICVNWVQKIM